MKLPPIQCGHLEIDARDFATVPKRESLRHANRERELSQSPVLILNRQPRGILEKYSRRQVGQLYEFLHNNNPPYRYVFGFRRKGSSEPVYKNADKFKRLPVSKSIDWTLRTISGIDGLDKRHAYVPLPNNPNGQSRWGGLDFDAHHEGELSTASDLAIRAFIHVVNEPLFVVLETSGVGFKLWMIANEFRKVSWWTSFLEKIVFEIGASPQSGVVELFPNREPQNYGRGLRCLGSWNPRNDEINRILFDDLDQLLAFLDAPAARERSYLSSRETGCSAISRETEFLQKFAIREPATRHDRLLAMVGLLIVRYSHDLALQLAERQFTTKAVSTKADLREHLAEFEQIWEWALSEWRETLTHSEGHKFDALTTETERAAFRIIRDFHRSASHSGGAEFPISRDSLASRLQITGQGAGKLRFRFCEAGIIQLVKAWVPNTHCAYYRWTA